MTAGAKDLTVAENARDTESLFAGSRPWMRFCARAAQRPSRTGGVSSGRKCSENEQQRRGSQWRCCQSDVVILTETTTGSRTSRGRRGYLGGDPQGLRAGQQPCWSPTHYMDDEGMPTPNGLCCSEGARNRSRRKRRRVEGSSLAADGMRAAMPDTKRRRLRCAWGHTGVDQRGGARRYRRSLNDSEGGDRRTC